MKESAIAEAASTEMSEYRQSERIQVRNVISATLARGTQKSLREAFARLIRGEYARRIQRARPMGAAEG